MKDYVFYIQALQIVSGASIKCIQCVVFQNQEKKRVFLCREDLQQFLRLLKKEGVGATYLNARRKKRKSLVAMPNDGVEIRVDGEIICVASIEEFEHIVAILREKPLVILEEVV